MSYHDPIVIDLMPKFLWDNYHNKGFARELVVIYWAVEGMIKKISSNGITLINWYSYAKDRNGVAIACEKLHKKYWERFHKVYVNRAKANGGWPHMNRTEALKEFLAMGYIYKTDIDYTPKEHYCIYSHIGGLWWPEAFESHQDAIKIQTQFGLPGYTGTTLPK